MVIDLTNPIAAVIVGILIVILVIFVWRMG